MTPNEPSNIGSLTIYGSIFEAIFSAHLIISFATTSVSTTVQIKLYYLLPGDRQTEILKVPELKPGMSKLHQVKARRTNLQQLTT